MCRKYFLHKRTFTVSNFLPSLCNTADIYLTGLSSGWITSYVQRCEAAKQYVSAKILGSDPASSYSCEIKITECSSQGERIILNSQPPANRILLLNTILVNRRSVISLNRSVHNPCLSKSLFYEDVTALQTL